MKKLLLISAICLAISPNLASAHRFHQGFHRPHMRVHHGGFHHHHHHYPRHHFHHHHHRYGYGWAVPAALLVGGIVGATITANAYPSYPQNYRYVTPPPTIYPNPYVTAYPPPPPANPSYVEATTPPDNGFWHYCPSAKRYYPYVKTCPEAWLEVVPR